ncbi:MAG: phosphonate C-P lyase system protein PhnG [Kiloniellales bacterium]|nr:phosphonate C-P lyase system protein PhnG [Kiloniellales bacterium]
MAARRAWMSLLARASPEDLEAVWDALEDPPSRRWLRRPETGLVMVRGRAGGTGQAFNLGEMTVTRCVLATEEGYSGHATVAGRDARHAELAACFDALLQDPRRRPALERDLLARLERARAAADRARAAAAAATKVEFFTLVRGED